VSVVSGWSLAFTLATLAAAVPATAQVRSAATTPTADRRVGLRAGRMDAAQALWNLRLVAAAPKPARFMNDTDPGDFGFLNSDLAFTGHYVIQGNFHGLQVWDIAQPAKPVLVTSYICPDAQNDVSVYRNLLFTSGEDFDGRLDCGTQGVADTVSTDRMRGIRIFDISDITHPKPITAVQTCRGSHTHTLLVDPNDTANVYIYVSGGAPVRPASELAGCSALAPDKDPNSELFRIEVIQVPVAHPEQARVVSKPAILADLAEPHSHPEAAQDIAHADSIIAAARAQGAFIARIRGRDRVVPPRVIQPLLDGIVKAGGGNGPPTAMDSAALRGAIQSIVDTLTKPAAAPPTGPGGSRPGPVQCHDITVYPAIGRAGGACAGYGVLLDIRDPANPRRIGAVADSNFAFWHSATFNNDGTKVLFTDEWGGGLQPKCRPTRACRWRGRDLHGRPRYDDVPELLQDPGRPDAAGELCGAQRVADSRARARPHGSGLVSGWGVGVRLHRPGASPGDRVFRPRPDGFDQTGGRRVVGRVLVQRLHRQLGDRARARHSRAAPQPAAVGERDRGGQAGALRPAERAGPAAARLAGEFRGGARLPGPAGADPGSGRRPRHRGARVACTRRAARRRRAPGRSDPAGRRAGP